MADYKIGKLCEKHPDLGGSRYKNGDCVTCKYDKNTARRAGNPESTKDYMAKYYIENKERRLGMDAAYRLEHKSEANARAKAWYKGNTERAKANVAAHVARNKDKVDAYKAVWGKAWREANPAKHCAKSNLRRANKINATPAWANHFFIGEVYDLARLRTKATGFVWHVDHIVPLKGKNVCGLHVEYNLQVIPAIENYRKNNSHIS